MADAGCYRSGMNQTVPNPAGHCPAILLLLPFVTQSMALFRCGRRKMLYDELQRRPSTIWFEFCWEFCWERFWSLSPWRHGSFGGACRPPLPGGAGFFGGGFRLAVPAPPFPHERQLTGILLDARIQRELVT